MKARVSLGIAISLLLALPAAADIIEWRDRDGVRHFTNLREEIPAENRDAAQVVVDEAVHHGPTDTEPPTDAAPAEAPRQAQVIYDRSAVRDAYMEGVQRGMELGDATWERDRDTVQINGPLAVATTAAPPFVAPFRYAYPLVTTAFDGGRSRHLTLRMLLENQSAIDRDGPFALLGGVPFDPRVPVFLPRNLVPSAPCARRVRRR